MNPENKQGNVLVIGSINMDLVVGVDKIPEIGETRIGRFFHQHPGGKGANQAVAAARLDTNVAMIGCVGKDVFGEQLCDRLEQEEINVSGIMKVADFSSGTATITVDQHANNFIVVAPGANGQLKCQQINHNVALIEWADLVVLQLEIPVETVEYAVNLAKNAGKPVLLNLAPYHQLNKKTLSSLDYLVLNKVEAQALLNIKSDRITDLVEGLKDFQATHVFLTLGEEGAIHVYNNQYVKYDAYRVNALDTTGAGDSFIGALACQIVKGIPLDNAVRFATKASAVTVTKLGAQDSLPYMDDIHEFDKKLKGRVR